MPSAHFHGETGQAKQAGNHVRLHADGRSARRGFWNRPIAATIALFDRDGISVNAAPSEADQFADSKSGPARRSGELVLHHPFQSLASIVSHETVRKDNSPEPVLRLGDRIGQLVEK
jgi:hypothetical protein